MSASGLPKVFLSYSYDGADHIAWVRQLATDLRQKGVDAILDQWDLSPGQDLAQFMERGLSEADRAIIVCTENYTKKANAGTGGVGYEKMIVTKELISNIATNKFIPIVRSNALRTAPTFLGARKYVDFNSDDTYSEALEELIREIHQAPRHLKPPLGPNPFAPTASFKEIASIRDVMTDPWFQGHRATGLPKAQAFSPGTMEVSFGARDWSTSVNQKDLLEAGERSAVHTFGWPIGVVLHVDDGKPRVTKEGLIAEIETDGFSDRTGLDYWALRSNGDFYLVHNLFEDGRQLDSIFFDSRMVRVAESFMYCRNLYSAFACPQGTTIDFRVRHTGLRGRKLAAASPNRRLAPTKRVSTEDDVETSVSFKHLASDDDVVRLTKAVLDPLFILFNLFQPRYVVYEEVVKGFIGGRTS
jgi:hypothetical protein